MLRDDNPYSEALFRTLKYRPEYPHKPFENIEAARAWVTAFVAWYNAEHQHSGIRFVTPNERHDGRDDAVLANRVRVYERARRRHPNRRSGGTRDWSAAPAVFLNPKRNQDTVASNLAGRAIYSGPQKATTALTLTATTTTRSPGAASHCRKTSFTSIILTSR